MGYGVSSFIIKWVNFLTLGVSFCVLGLGIWLSTKHGDCDEFLTAPVIIVGIFVFLISLLGFVGSWKDIAWLLWIYLVIMFFLLAGLALFTAFAFVITNEGAGRAISGQGFEEYRLADYSGYIRKLFNNHQIWKHLRACLLNPDYCAEIGRTYSSVADLKSGQLNSIQSGCCRPPSECKFPMINATYYDLSSRYVQTNSSSVSIGKSNVTGISGNTSSFLGFNPVQPTPPYGVTPTVFTPLAPWGTTPQDEPPPPGATPDEPPPPAGATPDEPPPPAGATPDEPPPPGATPDEPPPPAGATPDEPPPPAGATPDEPPPPAGATPDEPPPPAGSTPDEPPPPAGSTPPDEPPPPAGATPDEPPPPAGATPDEPPPPAGATPDEPPPPAGATPDEPPPPAGATPDEPPPPAGATPDEPPPPAGATPDEPPPPAGATPDEPPPPAGSTPPDEPPPPPDSTPPDEPPPAGATPAAPVVKFAAVSGSRQPPRAQLKVRRVKTINVSSTLVQHDAAPSPIKHYDDPDCVIYQNDPDTMCFECDSCKAGVAQFIKKDWRLVAIINIAVLLFLVALYTVGCCARRNASRAQYSKEARLRNHSRY
ncbi:protein MpTET3b [Marchantia polymorpha subsp. ruderalis]